MESERKFVVIHVREPHAHVRGALVARGRRVHGRAGDGAGGERHQRQPGQRVVSRSPVRARPPRRGGREGVGGRQGEGPLGLLGTGKAKDA